MAELKKADLGKRGNEETMVKKFLHMDGLMDTFLHKDGQFKPHAMVLDMDGEEHPYEHDEDDSCLLYTSPSPRDLSTSRMPSSA